MLTFLDGDNSTVRILEYRGDVIPLDIVWPAGKEMVIWFEPDDSFSRPGFELMITATNETGIVLL